MLDSIIDAHQHFWDTRRFQYPWITPKLESLARPYLPEHLVPILSETGVNRTVVVQAISSREEVRWLLDLASAHDFIAGVVTWADLASPTLGNELDELQRHPKFKGIRHQIEEELDDNWMLREKVLRGLQELERREIPYDLLIRPRHLRYLSTLRERCTRLRLVIDHIAKPQIAERKFDEWARDLEQVSKLPGIWCKLSGMNTEAIWESWISDDLRPYIRHAVAAFGYERVMFGSDWPVCTLAGDYQRVLSALRDALGPLNEEQSQRVWCLNAAEFYRLN